MTASGNDKTKDILVSTHDDDSLFSTLSRTTQVDRKAKNILLKSHGRPPWYNLQGRIVSDAFVIGIGGGSASGKTHVARQIVRALGNMPSVVILSQDSFYRRHSEEELELAFASRYDFDHPDAIDMPLFASCIRDLKQCRQTNVPIYSFKEHQRLEESQYLYGATIVIAEGIMTLHDPGLRSLYDLKIFVQCDSDLMLARRLRRDVTERGRDVEGILQQYLRYVKPSYDTFVQPSAKYADIIVPGSENAVAIDLISNHIGRMLKQRSFAHRSTISKPLTPIGISSNLVVLDQTPQVKGVLTILRDKTSPNEEVIFSADRLSTMIIEKAMTLLPFRPKSVETPTGVTSCGKELDVKTLCGVSVLPAAGALEQGVKRVLHDAAIGSLLIQPDPNTGEPLLFHTMLPYCIRDRERASKTWVLLLDTQISTGSSGLMAIRVLLDHGVLEEHIIFATFLVALGRGVEVLRKAFPAVKIVAGTADDYMVEGSVPREDGRGDRKVWVIQPGMGQIGDRYYT